MTVIDRSMKVTRMKTVKQYLTELDADKLVETYFGKRSKSLADYYYDAKLEEEDDEDSEYYENIKNMSVMEFAENKIKLLHEYIDYLKTLVITESEDGKQGIIYAYRCLDGYYSLHESVCTEMVLLEELLENPDGCENYGYIFTKFSEILSFFVADNKYTQENIYDVIADVLWNASYMGYRQEDLEKEQEYLTEIEESPGEMHSYDSPEEMFKAIIGEDGLKEIHVRQYEETEKSRKLLDAAEKAKYDYELFSMRRERQILAETVRGLSKTECK